LILKVKENKKKGNLSFSTYFIYKLENVDTDDLVMIDRMNI